MNHICRCLLTVLLILLTSLAVTQSVNAGKAPLSPEGLQRGADLTVVGQVEKLRIETERSRVESGFGNYDWAIYVTIEVDAVEKGTLSEDTIEARCFRIKSRRSAHEYLTPSGNRPIPGVGTDVRAYLCGVPDSWNVVFPNGLASPDPTTELVDASELRQLGTGGFTYLLPAEIWLVLVLVGVPALVVGKLLLRRFRQGRSKQGAVSLPANATRQDE